MQRKALQKLLDHSAIQTMMNRCVHVTGDFIANAADHFNHTRAPELDGVVDIIQTPEALEKSGGKQNYETRHRSFFPISFMHSNLYEMS